MIRSRQKLGKYRIRRRIGRGGYADVFEALDTIEGIAVALKVPSGIHVDAATMTDFRKEIRLTAKLDHPNILSIKNAEFIGDRLVVAYPLGDGSLGERLTRRLSSKTALDYGEQLLEALAHAHEHHIIHCDVKPENLILFPDNVLKLSDFGIAKVAMKTVQASGTGSVGYMAPEQAMGRPNLRSDVFAAGMIIYRMLTGRIPGWPLTWPPVGHEKLRRYGPELSAFLQKAIELDPKRRYRDADAMLTAYMRIKPRVLAHLARGKKKKRKNGSASGHTSKKPDWRAVWARQYRKQSGGALSHDADCGSCGEPLDERMRSCPFCGVKNQVFEGDTRFPSQCERCNRGVKLDWKYCAWCHGGAIGPESTRRFTDKRYSAKCSNSSCERRDLMPFMKYCPWCRTKVARKWKLGTARAQCGKCGSGVIKGFWEHCAWCGAGVAK